MDLPAYAVCYICRTFDEATACGWCGRPFCGGCVDGTVCPACAPQAELEEEIEDATARSVIRT
jgi:hypothetical protein